jgi:AraC-like DNA-binding protein
MSHRRTIPTQAGTEPEGAYGARLAESFGMNEVPALVTRRLSHQAIGVTLIRCDRSNNGLTAPLPCEDAFLATLQLRECPAHDLWLDGVPQATGALHAGATCIYDLRSMPVVNSVSPFRNMHFYLPRQTLNRLAEQDGMPPVEALEADPGHGVEDSIIAALGSSLEPAFNRPHEVTQLFIDHVILGLASHLVRVYGTTRSSFRAEDTGSLSTAQERAVKDMLRVNLAGHVGMEELAKACGMGLTAFRRAFARSTGMMPHQWLLGQRVEQATAMIADTGRDLGEIAIESGFADLNHMERVFRQMRGASPASLRGH